MGAVVCQNAELRVEQLPEPVPGRGAGVRLQVLRCGICGSDLRARRLRRVGRDGRAAAMTGSRAPISVIVFGHEFCGEVAEYGPRHARVPAGTPVVAMPLLRNDGVVDATGLSLHAPGAYAEQVLAEEALMTAVPNGLAPEVAALTEPMAVVWHAVRRAEVRKRDVAIVIGCSPVGLGDILMLKAKGVRAVVASDFSAGRRALARICGADIVVDPASGSPTPSHRTRATFPTCPRRWSSPWRRARSSGACPSAGGTCGASAKRSAPSPSLP
ncbi:MAG: alcohol dehydrogenase catalytic domain-containing protein [Solirubrobacterales bacterium]